MTYKELRKQQQARFNKLPMKAACGDKQDAGHKRREPVDRHGV